MSAEAIDPAVDELVAQLPRRRMSGKKLVLLLVLPLLLLVGGGAGLYFSGLLDSLMGGHGEEAEEGGHAPAPVADSHGGGGHGEEALSPFFNVPDLLVNLNTAERRQNFLKISISLELDRPEDAVVIQALMPRIIDNFQVYLRELRLEDLRGSAGLYRLREELLRRVNAAVAPAHVKDVLFREMLVQ
jgi:flagellar FliL protein